MKRVSGILALTLLAAGPALACDYPQDTVGDEIPRGATASADEMKTAQRRVANYVKALEDYAACVDAEPSARRQAMLRDRDRAVQEAENIADRINKEIRQYNRSLQLRQASAN